MQAQGRYIRYRDKTPPCARCRKSHGVLSMRFDMARAVEDASLKLRDQIDAELLQMMLAPNAAIAPEPNGKRHPQG